MAIALDLAAIAVAELADISERRVEQLVNPALSSGLTPFLAKDSGLHSGFMIAQVASASLVSENKVLCHPASVDSIPSSAGREDHVSMGSIAAKKLRAGGRERDAARSPSRCSPPRRASTSGGRSSASRGVAAAHAAVRRVVPELGDDRPLYPDIAAVAGLLGSGALIRATEEAVGPLRLKAGAHLRDRPAGASVLRGGARSRKRAIDPRGP